MKINHKNFPVIDAISNKKFNFLVDNDDMELIRSNKLSKIFIENCDKFNKINYVSKPFLKSLDLCIDKLWNNVITETFNDNGTFILKREDGIMETYCYDFELKDMEHPSIVFFYFQEDMLIKYLNKKEDVSYCCEESLSDGLISCEQAIQNELQNLMRLCLFTKYASIETKILKPNQKIKDIVCKYKNETNLNINILDSKWFTNLVKSDGFTVRGHFRLQPKKINGEMSKELIWISDFQKTGYTAPARMLS